VDSFLIIPKHGMATMPAKIRVTGPNCMHKLPTNMLKLLSPLFANLDDTMLEGKSMYRIKNDRKDMKGQDVSGFFVVQGIIQALSPTKTVVVTTETAPSLALVDNGKGKSVKVLNLADLVNIFELHWEAECVARDIALSSMPTSSVVENVESTSIVKLKSTISTVVDKQRMQKVSAVAVKELVGFENVDIGLLDGSSLRQLCQGYIDDHGTLIGGRFITVDVVAVVLFDGNLVYARQWLNNLLSHGKIAPSLAYVASGHPSVSVLELINI